MVGAVSNFYRTILLFEVITDNIDYGVYNHGSRYGQQSICW